MLILNTGSLFFIISEICFKLFKSVSGLFADSALFFSASVDNPIGVASAFLFNISRLFNSFAIKRNSYNIKLLSNISNNFSSFIMYSRRISFSNL